MNKVIALNPERTHILVKKNNELPNSSNGENIGKYSFEDNEYEIYIIKDIPFNHKLIPIKDFNEFDLPFIVYNDITISLNNIEKSKYGNNNILLKKISNVILIIIILLLIICLIKYITSNYTFILTDNIKQKL